MLMHIYDLTFLCIYQLFSATLGVGKRIVLCGAILIFTFGIFNRQSFCVSHQSSSISIFSFCFAPLYVIIQIQFLWKLWCLCSMKILGCIIPTHTHNNRIQHNNNNPSLALANPNKNKNTLNFRSNVPLHMELFSWSVFYSFSISNEIMLQGNHFLSPW